MKHISVFFIQYILNTIYLAAFLKSCILFLISQISHTMVPFLNSYIILLSLFLLYVSASAMFYSFLHLIVYTPAPPFHGDTRHTSQRAPAGDVSDMTAPGGDMSSGWRDDKKTNNGTRHKHRDLLRSTRCSAVM